MQSSHISGSRQLVRLALAFCLLSATLILISCGGGGGGGVSEPATLQLDLSSNNLDTGDFTQVKIAISDVVDNGILLKVRYPTGLIYVRGSSVLTTPILDNGADIEPGVDRASGDKVYLVYFLSADIFGDKRHGELTFRLKGISAISDGQIEVDADENDPSIPDSHEFDVNNPAFSAVDSHGITVHDSSASGTPTATATASK